MDFMNHLKPSTAARFKGGAASGNGRDKVIADVDKQIALIGTETQKGEFRWFTVQGDQAKLSFRYGRRVIKKNGNSFYDLPAAKLKTVLEGFKASVMKGEWDAEIAATKANMGKKADGSPRTAPKRKAA